MNIKKSDLKDSFGGVTQSARALECSRRQMQYLPDDLPTEWADRAVGAMLRLQVKLPTTVKRAMRKALAA